MFPMSCFYSKVFFKQKTHKGHDLILFTLWILMYRRSCMVHSNETRTYYLRSRLISCVNPVWIFRTLDSQKNLLHWTGQEYFFTVCVNPFSRDGGINTIMESEGLKFCNRAKISLDGYTRRQPEEILAQSTLG